MHSPTTLGFHRSGSATAIITKKPEAFSKVVPEGPTTLGFHGSRRLTAIIIRRPEAFSKLVPEGGALARIGMLHTFTGL